MAMADSALPRLDLASLPVDASVRPDMDVVGGIDPELRPEEVIAAQDQIGFRRAEEAVPQFPANSGDTWLRFEIGNASPDVRSAKLVIRFPYLEHVDLFERRPDGTLHHSSAGAAALLTGDAIAAAYPAFHLYAAPQQTKEYFVRVRSDSVVILPVMIAPETEFSRRMTTDTLIWSLISGAALAFAIYAASMSFSTANGVFRAYFFFAVFAAAYIFLSSGLLNAIFGAGLEFSFTRLVFVMQAVLMAVGTIFLIVFLNMEKHAPRLFRLFCALAFIGAVTAFSHILPPPVGEISYFIATGAGPLIIGASLAWMAVRGVSGARTALMAWFPCLLATLWIYFRVFNLTPYLPINHFLLPLSFAFTLAYLCAVLGGRARQTELWANSDPMTGLGNRRLLYSITELESRQPGERYGSAVAIDLDQFKPINDTYGHAAGDAVLVAVAERLRTHFAGRADIFRLGADEFLVLGYDWVSRMDIITHANAFLQACLQPVGHDDIFLKVGASIGIAFHDNRTGFTSMLKQADAELYHMKQGGRGGIRIADQRQRDRRRSEPVLFADNDTDEEQFTRLFQRG